MASVAITAGTAQGNQVQMTATATLSNGTTQNVTTQSTWASSNNAVATVNGAGLVNILTPGEATISATYQQVTGRLTGTFTGPQITRYTVAGVLTDANTGRPVVGGTVTATNTNTTNARSGTDGNGYYSIPGVATGSTSLRLEAPNYITRSETITVGGDMRHDTRITPFFRRTGSGDTVFDLPTSVSRVRIVADYPGNSSNFVVYIAGRLIVNELIGRGWSSTHFEGTYLTTGGTVEIRLSSGVSWEFQQVQ